MNVSEYVKEVTAIRADYEARLDRARAGYDACRETLEIEHDRALRAEESRDGLLDAAEAVLFQIDYLQNLWSKEGVTDRLAGTLRAAVAKAKGSDDTITETTR